MLTKSKQDSVNIPPAYHEWNHQLYNRHHRKENKNNEDILSPTAIVKRTLKRFAESTSLHGLKYLSEPKRPIYERLFWLLTLAVVYVAAVKTVMEQISNYQTSPVIVSLDAEPTYIHYIPFPALSICPVDPSIVHPDVNASNPLYKQELDLGKFICHGSKGNHLRTDDEMKYVSQEAAERVLKSMFSYEMCTKIIQGIIFMNQIDRDPCKKFQPTSFRMGFCFTYNMVPHQIFYRNTTHYSTMHVNGSHHDHPEDVTWSIDEGYPMNYPTDRLPRRIGGNGFENGVGILVKSPDPNQTCLGDLAEISVVVHGPHELPGSNHIQIPVHFDSYTIAQVKPRIVNTSEILMQWTPTQRGCYFETERQLVHFQKYNQNNCDLECEANRTLEICKCSPLHHPRQNGTAVCGTDRFECVKSSLVREASLLNKAMFCDCKPSCNEIEFDVHSSSYSRNWSRFFGALDRHEKDDVRKLSFSLTEVFKDQSSGVFGGVHVSYLTKFPVAVRRNSILGGIHFIGNIGGLLGLFLGFSFISLAEIVYFFLVRPCYRFCKVLEDKETNTDPETN